VGAAFALWVGFHPTIGARADPAANVPRFERDIVPIVKAYCWRCHGGEARVAKLDLRTLPLLLRGGENGPAIVRGSSAKSLLFRKFPELATHPPANSRPTPAHIATLRAWIDAGAPADYEGGPVPAEDAPPLTAVDRNKWAFRTPVRPRVHSLRDAQAIRTPVDAFVLQKLEAGGLTFSPQADRVTLIRRAAFDLIGLPPSPREVDAFVQDSRPDAYERLLERLLASPHYGERWGRHWLDAAGYVDTRGTDNDAGIMEPLDGIWKYRDYVIGAFNDDRPFDRFLLEQLAGDEQFDWRHAKQFSAADRELLTATGFLRLAADVTYAPELNTSDIRHQVLFDTVQIVSSNLLGLTVHCAQCHTHKFDPISHADYYRLAGIFMPAYDPQDWRHSKERTLADVAPCQQAAIDAANVGITRDVENMRREIANLRKPPDGKPRDAKRTVARAGKVLAKGAADLSTGGRRAAAKDRVTTVRASAKGRQTELEGKIAALEGSRKQYGTIQALWDLGPAPDTYIYRRGDFRNPGAQIEPGVIAILDDPAHPFQPPHADAKRGSTGLRTAFAKWLTNDRHPLTARVYVNRIWLHHFGRGIVATPENFGASGLAPSHPELLDWLAREFISSGWDVKHLHRLIMTSAAYRQSSRSRSPTMRETADPLKVDPDNILLWKMPLQRHESEVVRDAVLATSGILDTRMGGVHVPLKSNSNGSVEIDLAKLHTPSDEFRRSLYLFSRRNYQLTELSVFDQPIVATNCTCRTSSAVVSQSLALLNGKFAIDQSEIFARRVAQYAGENPSRRIVYAFRIAFGRAPSAEETTLAETLLREQAEHYRTDRKAERPSDQAPNKKAIAPADAALANLCQMLLNTNEFLYSQ
jgi:hypothetical protein